MTSKRWAESRWTAALVYAICAIVITWPLATSPDTLVAGGARSDALNSIWNLWFAHRGVARGELPIYTDLLDPPTGGRIAIADPLNAVLGLPLVHVFGPVAAYAVLVVGHLWLAGFAAHLLGRRLGGGGWVAGFGFQWAPILLSHVHNGSSEAVSAGMIPLALLAVVEATERGGLGRMAVAGFGLFVVAVSGWYAGVGAFFVVLCILLLGWEGVAHRQVVGRLLPALVLGLALTAPLAIGVRSIAEAEDGLVDIKNPSELARIRRTLGAADPRVFVYPGEFRSPDLKHLEANPSDRIHTAYLGFALVLLAIRHGRRRPYWLATVGLIVLAMGPVVVIGGLPANIRGHALPLPYSILELLPGFSSLSLLYRLATVPALLLAVLADRARGRWALLVLGEVLLVSPMRGLPDVSPVERPAPIVALRDRPEGIVVNLPVLAGRNFLFEQTIHEKPVAGSLNSGMNRPGLRLLAAARKVRAGELTTAELTNVAKREGVRYVVFHKNTLMAETFVASWTGIRRNFEALGEDEDVAVYELW